MRSKSIAIGGKFKPSPLGPIPKDWEVVRLGDVCNILTGYAFSSKFFNTEGRGLPLIRIRDLGKIQTEAYYDGPYSQEYVVNSSDILIGMDGEFNVDMWKGPLGLLNQRVSKLWPMDNDRIDKYYLYYAVCQPIKNLEYLIGITTVRHLSTRQIANVRIPLPPLPEQKRIAEVLRTVDEAIEKVDREMEHTERLKRGLMQHLLTRGIGHTRFKDSPLGKIPETWEVVRLKELTLKMFGGGTPSTNKKEYWDGDIPWITSAHINGMYVQDGQRYISQEGVEHSSTNIVPSGNIIVATRVGIGKVAIAKIDVAISQDLTGMVVNRDRVFPEFLYWLLSFNHFGLKRFAQGSTIKGVLRSTIANMHLPLPPLPEQRKIAEILMTVDRKLELLRREKEHLQRLKKGLMDDLLTGRRRLRVEGQSSRSPLTPELHHTPPSPSTGEGRGGDEENERS